jgi:glycosyltransferase involved in cell wall biosynthesis
MKAVWFNQLDFDSLCKTSRLELAAALCRVGHRLRIVGRSRRRRPRLAGMIPRPLLLTPRLPDPAGGIFFQLQAMLLALCEIMRKADLILVDHYCAPTMLPFNVLSRAGLIATTFVLDVRSAPVDMAGLRGAVSRGRYNVSLRLAKLFYDGITVITNLYREDVSRRLRMDPAKIGVWGSGVREDVFDPQRVDKARAKRIRSGLGVNDKIIVIYHGILSSYRGLQETVRAFGLLRAEGFDRAVLVLLGDGPAAAEIRSLARSEGVSDAVKLIPSVPYREVPVYLSVADAGILPFPSLKWWNMSCPLKLIEYLAMEKPVVLTDIPGHRAVVGGSECAFYIRDNSPATIALAIRNLAERKDSLTRIGKEGRKIVLEKFTWENQAHNLLNYIASLDRRKGR